MFVSINNSRYHAYKLDSVKAVGDAKVTVKALAEKLRAVNYVSSYNGEIEEAKAVWDKEMKRLAEYKYDETFEPMIKNMDPRTIPEFVELTKGKITQTAALATIRDVIDEDATIITAGGSLPSCMQRVWTNVADIMQSTDIPVWDMKLQQHSELSLQSLTMKSMQLLEMQVSRCYTVRS